MSVEKIKVYRDADQNPHESECPDGFLRIELPPMCAHATDVYLDCLEVLNSVFLGALPSAAESSEVVASGRSVPSMQPPRSLFREAAMLADARQRILQDGDWATTADLSTHLKVKRGTLKECLSAWLRDGLMTSFNYRGHEYFPVFAFDHSTEFRPLHELSAVVKVLSKKKDGWGIAFWFATSNSYLGGRLPKDLLRSAAESVLSAAEDEVSGVLHG